MAGKSKKKPRVRKVKAFHPVMQSVIDRLAVMDLKSLERETGVPYATLYSWVARGTAPKLNLLVKVLDYLGLDLYVVGRRQKRKTLRATVVVNPEEEALAKIKDKVMLLDISSGRSFNLPSRRAFFHLAITYANMGSRAVKAKVNEDRETMDVQVGRSAISTRSVMWHEVVGREQLVGMFRALARSIEEDGNAKHKSTNRSGQRLAHEDAGRGIDDQTDNDQDRQQD